MTPRPDLQTVIWSADWAVQMINRGELGLPDFQRRFEWTSADVKAFLSTVLAGLPSGNLMVAENHKLRLELRELEGAPPLSVPPAEIFVLLDGQQRLTALYHAVTDTGPDRYAVDATALLEGADLLQDDVIASSPARSFQSKLRNSHGRQRILIPLSALTDSRTFLTWLDNLENYTSRPVGREIRDELGDLFADKLTSISNYNLPVTMLGGDLDLATTAQVFERTNKWGQKLDAFDLMVARLRAGGWSLRDAWEEAVTAHPSIRRLFGANGLVAISAISLREQGDVRRNALLSLNSRVVEKLWEGVVHACDDVASALVAQGFRRSELLPYDVAVSNLIALRMDQLPLEQLMEYVWRVGANRRYEVASNTSVAGDYRAMSKGNDVMELGVPNVGLDVIERNSKRSSRALWATLVAAMLSLEPCDLMTGLPISPGQGPRDEEWDVTSFVKGGGLYESEFDTPARFRTAGQLLYQRSGGSKLRTHGLRWVVEERSRQPMLYGPSIEECLESQLLPRDTARLLTSSPRDLVHGRAIRLRELVVERGWPQTNRAAPAQMNMSSHSV